MLHLFISDLHLSEQRPALFRAFASFIDQYVPGAASLYILGDFFDVWIGDGHDTAFNRAVIDCLKQASSQVPVYFMHGNRDFLVGQSFCQQAGMTLLDDPHRLHLYGKDYLLMHGDTLCTDDQEYIRFRQMVRDPQWQREFLSKPLDEREAIAHDLRQRSQSMAADKAEDIMDVNLDTVAEVLQSHDVDTLIHGHTHRPNVHCLNVNGSERQRIVLGDWHDKGWVLRINEQGEFLDAFPIPTAGE